MRILEKKNLGVIYKPLIQNSDSTPTFSSKDRLSSLQITDCFAFYLIHGLYKFETVIGRLCSLLPT